MKIGNLKFQRYPLLLAPMEDVTDASFRRMCKHYGADLMYTEFVASEAIIRNVEKSMKKMRIEEQERPIGIQLYGHQIESMVEAARMAEAMKPDLIDINYGCPVKKIATRGAGAGMLRDVPKMSAMTEAIVKATDLPVTVKTRLGWDEQSKNIEEVAERLQDTGIHALTIHGRTRAQLYKGKADWSLIGKVKNKPGIQIPIIGNGDITDGPSAQAAIDNYGVDGIMIGRGTIGRPWIFKEIRHYLKTGKEMDAFPVEERVRLARMHFDESVRLKGSPKGIYEMRTHFIHYFKGLPDFKPIRMRLVTTLDIPEIHAILDEILEIYGNQEQLHQTG